MTVRSGGTLGGSGHLSGITVSSSGQLAPGDALGTQMNVTGNLILASGAVMDYELDTPSTSDTIVCGSLTLNQQQFSAFDFTWTTNLGPGSYDLIGVWIELRHARDDHQRHDRRSPATLSLQSNDLVLDRRAGTVDATLLGACVVGLLGWTWRRRLGKFRT